MMKVKENSTKVSLMMSKYDALMTLTKLNWQINLHLNCTNNIWKEFVKAVLKGEALKMEKTDPQNSTSTGSTQALVILHLTSVYLSLLISAADEVEFVVFRMADPALISSRLNCSRSHCVFTVLL